MSIARRESVPVMSLKIKLHDRRVTGNLMADGTILWKFKSLNADRTIGVQYIRLSTEALAAMVCIADEIGVIRRHKKEGQK